MFNLPLSKKLFQERAPDECALTEQFMREHGIPASQHCFMQEFNAKSRGLLQEDFTVILISKIGHGHHLNGHAVPSHFMGALIHRGRAEILMPLVQPGRQINLAMIRQKIAHQSDDLEGGVWEVAATKPHHPKPHGFYATPLTIENMPVTIRDAVFNMVPVPA